ncbi:unnamed protein product [Camellia sinensis]
MAAGSFNHHGMRYSTTVPNYPDTHEDFMPTNKLQNSDLSLKDIVEQDVNDNPVTIYMKGLPDLPRCGFSSLAVVRDDHVVGLSCLRKAQEDETMEALKEELTGANFVAGILFNVPLSARNILEDPELKNAVKSFSWWVQQLAHVSTDIHQGEFVGGSDIILNMHQTGELKEMLKDIAANQEN